MKVYANVDGWALAFSQSFEALRHLVDALLSFDVFERRSGRVRCYFHRVDAGGGIDLTVDAHPVASRATEQLVYRYAIHLALDVPKRLIDPAEDSGLDGSAAIERATVDRLPMKRHAIGILADQVAAHFQRAGSG